MEETAGAWLVELLGLSEGRPVTCAFTAGGSAAHLTALAAARHAQLAAAGWDVERRGVYGAPELHVPEAEVLPCQADRDVRLRRHHLIQTLLDPALAIDGDRMTAAQIRLRTVLPAKPAAE